MHTHKKIGIAFLLNLFFAFFELAGGSLTGSIAIVSDALHDFGDACSIGLAYVLERKSARTKDPRYSLLSAKITNIVLLMGSGFVLIQGVYRFLHPTPLHTKGMLAFALVGIAVNLGATIVTHGGHSHNQKAVNLHMLEDVLGWIAVLVGAIIIHFTGWQWMDPVLSVVLSLFIASHATRHLRSLRTHRPNEAGTRTQTP